MGYITDMNGRLCCDFCGTSGGVRRTRCPHNYCQRVAICPACRKEGKRKEFLQFDNGHESCRVAVERMRRRDDLESALLEQGYWVLTSAHRVGDGQVEAWLRNRHGRERSIVVPSNDYPGYQQDAITVLSYDGTSLKTYSIDG